MTNIFIDLATKTTITTNADGSLMKTATASFSIKPAGWILLTLILGATVVWLVSRRLNERSN